MPRSRLADPIKMAWPTVTLADIGAYLTTAFDRGQRLELIKLLEESLRKKAAKKGKK